MPELDWRVERRAGIALVKLTVRNPTDAARRVRVGNRLSGPVWPPRREGVPTAGWDGGGFEGVVAARDRRALGYASPLGAPADRAAESGSDRAVESPDSAAEPPAELVWSERAGESASETAPDAFADEATPEGVVRALGDPRPPADAIPAPNAPAETDTSVPGPVESWLSAVEERAADGSDPSAPTPADRAALGSVAGRIEALRNGDPSERRESNDAGRSP
ncbi:hypothetical protein M0R89_07550 [Halorussus limi]|uniref:Uncharacterized protein n=1 Tax=Halorussus limi TaxID=2938695 RepID=A0A8U0HYN9_9EURY|nr:hypothetical protein [Halorussus limi]UPV75903.1 hypothetical protein M0R89_07550 [Halorussus limi]